MPTRDEIRAKIFAAENTKRIGITTDFFGTTIELRQATVGQIQEMIDARNSGQSFTLASYLVNYSYVPGTEERVFDEADLEVLVQLPYNKDMQAIAGIVTRLSSIDPQESEKNSEEASSSGT